MLLFLPLTHNLLAAEPLLHGLLVAQSGLVVHLRASTAGSGLGLRTKWAFGARTAGGHKPPSFRLLTFQIDSGQAGKATPPYAARPLRRQSRPDGAAPSPHMSESRTTNSSWQFYHSTLHFFSRLQIENTIPFFNHNHHLLSHKWVYVKSNVFSAQ